MPSYTSPVGDLIRGGRFSAGAPETPETPVTPPSFDGISTTFVGGLRFQRQSGTSDLRYGRGLACVEGGTFWFCGKPGNYGFGGYTLQTPVDSTSISDYPVCANTIAHKVVSPEAWAGSPYYITGLWVDGNDVHAFFAEDYDAGTDNLQFYAYYDRSDDSQLGYYYVNGKEKSAGPVTACPTANQSTLGGSLLVGAARDISINGRKSNGPALTAWDGTVADPIAGVAHLHYGGSNGLGEMGSTTQPANPLWNQMSRTYTHYIQGDDVIFIGRTGGLVSGVGYKINGQGGYTSIDPADTYNYYWKYSLAEILAAENPWDPRPTEYGKLDWYTGGAVMNGATYDLATNKIYVICYNDWTQGGNGASPTVYVHELV